MPENLSRVSEKKIKIDKANTTMLATLAIATFVVVFSLVSIKALISQYVYQKRVSSAQQGTINKLKQDQSNAGQLVNSYSSFISQSPNILGGSNQGGTGSNQENNAQIILDALPSNEDVTATLAGIVAILDSKGATITGLSSSAASGTVPASTPAPSSTNGSSSAASIPFSFSTSGSIQSVTTILNALGLSIRPVQIQTLSLSGSDSDLTVSVTAQTYYQLPSSVSISSETVK